MLYFDICQFAHNIFVMRKKYVHIKIGNKFLVREYIIKKLWKVKKSCSKESSA